jgi:hypothetical protein
LRSNSARTTRGQVSTRRAGVGFDHLSRRARRGRRREYRFGQLSMETYQHLILGPEARDG